MARKQVIKPDFTINNINAVNNDPGARNFAGYHGFKPWPQVQRLDQNNSNIRSNHHDEHSVVNKINLTTLDFDGNTAQVSFSNNSDFSFVRTIEQNTINFTNNNANSKITVADDSTLSMNKLVDTVVSNFAKGTNNSYYSAADTNDLSFAQIEGETQVLNFAGDNDSRIEVENDSSLLFIEEVNTTVATHVNSSAADALGDVSDNDAFSFASDVQVSAVQFSANSNSSVSAADSDDFTFHDGTDDVPFSIAFWVNLTTVAASTRYIFGKWGAAYNFSYNTNGVISLTMYDSAADGGGTAHNAFASPQVGGKDFFEDSFDTWVHVAIVYTPETGNDTNDEQIQYYKNGSAWGSAVNGSAANYDSSQQESGKFVLGDYTSTSPTSQRMVGMLSNFLVFKHDGQNNHASVARSTTPLTANEVKGLYNGGRVMANYNNHPKSGDLVGYWKLDEDISEVSQITDYSGEDNHLNTIGSAVTENSTSGLFKKEDDSFTITVWIKKNQIDFGYILTKGTSSGSTREYSLLQVSRGFRFLINDNSPTDGAGSYGRATYETNGSFLSNSTTEWEHITVVYDAATQNVTFHRNGGSAQTGTANDTQTVTAAIADSDNDYDSTINLGATLTIGGFGVSHTQTSDFGGRMAHLAIFKYGKIANPMVATPNRVKGLYNGGFAYDYSLHHIDRAYLVAYWKLNNTTATINSPTLDITARGTGAFTTASDSDLKEKKDTDFTVSFWVKRKGTGIYAIIGKNQEYFVIIDNREVKLFLQDTTGGAGVNLNVHWVTGTTFLDNNTTNWQHVTIAYDASAKSVKFYKNGELGVTDSAPNNVTYNEMQDTTNKLYIGRTGNGFNHLLAELAHLAIFSHDGQSGRSSALMSDAEVYKLYDRDGTSGNASSVAGKVYHLKPVHAKAADLVGYWHLDEDVSSTATIKDYSGLSNDGATAGVGTTTLTNPANSGLDSADFVDVNFSISFWMKKASVSTTGGFGETILAKGAFDGSNLEYWVYRKSRRIELRLTDPTPTDGDHHSGIAFYSTNATFLSDNNTEWEHITIVYDASTQNTFFYRNGENVQLMTKASADTDSDYDAMANRTADLFIGQNSVNHGEGHGGQLAHVALFKHDGQNGRSSTVPTAAQVKGGYNGGNVYDLNAGTQHPKKADIVGYWKLNGTAATVGDTLTAGAGVSTSTATDLKTTTDVNMTFAFWFKKSAATGNAQRTIVAKSNEYEVYVYATSVFLKTVDAHPSDGGAASFKQFSKSGVVTDNTDWQHVVIKYTAGSIGGATVMVNGGTAASMTIFNSAEFDDFHDTTSEVTIGYGTSQPTSFAGQIAQLAIFKHDGLSGRSSTMLTDDEAKGLYNGGNVYDYTRHPKKDDLVGYWKLNQTVGNNVAVTDSSGEGNNGVMTGATSLTNPANSGLNEVKDNSFTVGFWMNKDSASDTGVVLQKPSEYQILLQNRKLQLAITDSTGMDDNSVATALAIMAGDRFSSSTTQWEHAVVSYDAANRQVLFFVNGALTDTISLSTDSDYNEMQDTGNFLTIGQNGLSFDGKLSNVIMFDHGAAGAPFDATDALELYSDGHVYDYNKHSRASDIVAWWKLAGNTLDSHSNTHTGVKNANATYAINSGLYSFEDQDFAIGFYVRPLDTPGHPAVRFFFDKQSANWSYYNDTNVFFKLRDQTPKQVSDSIAVATDKRFFFNYSPPPGVFTHMIYSYDSSEDKLHLYVNGVEQGSGATHDNSTPGQPDVDYQESQINEAGTFNIGNAVTQNYNPDADYSHFVIFKGRHLTEAEALELYNNGEGYNYTTHSRGSDISAFYKLNDSTATIIDYSGNGNNMTATNATRTDVESGPKFAGRKRLPQLPMRMSIPGLASLRTNPQK